jgi:hypothetical protein
MRCGTVYRTLQGGNTPLCPVTKEEIAKEASSGVRLSANKRTAFKNLNIYLNKVKSS